LKGARQANASADLSIALTAFIKRIQTERK